MATELWVTIGNTWCELIRRDVIIEEHREFPAGTDRERGYYLVLGKRCSAAVSCNLAGISCSGAYTNPNTDQFNPDINNS